MLANLGKPQFKPQEVTIPHDGILFTEHDKNNHNGSRTGFYDNFSMCYCKTFKLDEADKGKIFYIKFDGVYVNAFITVNDAFVGKCNNGYTAFWFEITRYLNFDKENKITVTVKNDPESSRWYTGGGIYRDITLYVAEPVHIKPYGVKVTTRKADEEYAVIEVQTEVENVGLEKGKAELKTEILDKEGNTVSCFSSYCSTSGRDENVIRQRLTVRKPNLWDTENPYLYSYKSTLLLDGGVVDESTGNFGIRTVFVDSINGLQLNGKKIKLRGGCIHQDNGIIGAMSFPAAEERKIKKLKDAGFNAIRCSHNPAGKNLLDACDKFGILVMDEFTDMWTRPKVDYDYSFSFVDSYKTDIKRMVDNDYNHPSVIMYSIGNEIAEAASPHDVKFGEQIANEIRKLDDSRYTLNSVNMMLLVLDVIDQMIKKISEADKVDYTAPKTKEINAVMNEKNPFLDRLKNHPLAAENAKETFSTVDVLGFNYGADLYEKFISQNQNFVMLGSETYPADLDYNWELVKKHNQILGDFVWTGYDYMGEAGIGVVKYGNIDPLDVYSREYCLTAGTGVLDLLGDMRPCAYWRQIVWGLRKEPYIAVQRPDKYGQKPKYSNWTWSDTLGSWNFKGYEGQPVVVEVYSDSDEVELFVNARSYGRKEVGERKQFVTLFDANYEQGEVTAVAYTAGKEVSRFTLKSGGKNRLFAVADKSEIKTNDLAYIDISVCDKDGILDMYADGEVAITVDGAGSLLGFGNADPYFKNNFGANIQRVYKGRACAAIRAECAGNIVVTVSSEYGSKTIKIQSLED